MSRITRRMPIAAWCHAGCSATAPRARDVIASAGSASQGRLRAAQRARAGIGDRSPDRDLRVLGARLADSYLATGNGDIIVLIPSNVGVNIRAQSDMADTLRRITSDFAAIQVRRQGRQVVGEGPVNGGGPLLQISANAGTIFIRRQ